MSRRRNPEWRTATENYGNRFIVYPVCERCNDFIWMHVVRRCMHSPFKYKAGRIGVAINTGDPTPKKFSMPSIRLVLVANNRTARVAKWKPDFDYNNHVRLKLTEREDEIYWAHYLIETGRLRV